jgi:hypothetical protein
MAKFISKTELDEYAHRHKKANSTCILRASCGNDAEFGKPYSSRERWLT